MEKELDLDKLFSDLKTKPNCPMCNAKIGKVKIVEKKTVIHVSRSHFCSWANGNCTVTATFYRKKKVKKKP